MELGLQLGFGMMEHCRVLARAWGGATVVLSPRDLELGQMTQLSADITKTGGQVLLDPQLFLPQANHARLIRQPHWPAGGSLQDPATVAHVLRNLMEMNAEFGTRQTILPGTLASKIDGAWLNSIALIQEAAARLGLSPERAVQTVALGHEAIRDDRQVEALVEAMSGWPAATIYLIAEAPPNAYLVGDPVWQANMLDVVASARLNGKRVIVGYANQQLLATACAGANTICSGTWMNVRAFMRGRFLQTEDDEIKQRSTWYYAPHLFSEYKIATLDIAQKVGLLELLSTPAAYGSPYADELFTSVQPTLAGFSEQGAFRHFLQSLRSQAADFTGPSFEDSLATFRRHLDEAQGRLERLHQMSITGKQRDFVGTECIDATRAALHVLERNHGPRLRRLWQRLP